MIDLLRACSPLLGRPPLVALRNTTLLLLFVLAQTAWAFTPFTVKDIRAEGLLRVEAGTVFATLPFRIGETFNEEKSAASIRALFALGLFKDVRIRVDKEVVVVEVEERPNISSIEFSGMREFDKDTLKKALKEIGLAEGRPYDRSVLDRAEQELKRQYVSRSLYAAQVQTTVTPQDRNRVSLNFNIIEGDTAKIARIQIVGAQAFSESTLLRQMDLDTGGVMSWYTKSNRYSRSKLNGDLETLRSYYLNRGYLEFRIDSTQVSLSTDKQSIDVVIQIHEGVPFVVSELKLDGNYLGKDEAFKTLVTVAVGEAYNAERVNETVKAFAEYFGVFGYAFARPQVKTDIDRQKNRVTLSIVGEPGFRAYVRRVNILGNAGTRDEVVRREFRQYESAWYDGDKIRLSRDRINRLGYFNDVNIEQQEVSGSPDQVDLNVTLVEKPTGSFTLGATYSSYEKLAFMMGLHQDNIFGSGHSLSVNFNTGKFTQNAQISTTDPYFTASGISRTIDVFHRLNRPYTILGGDYQNRTMGTSVRFGLPITETDRVFVGAGYEATRLTEGTNMPAAYAAYLNEFGSPAVAYPLSVGWTKDGRDSLIAPTRGQLQRLFTDASPWGETRYVRANYQFQQYWPLNKQFSMAFNTELGWGRGLDGRPYPVFKNYYSGGLGSVRGFEQGTLGPRDVTGSFIGGAKKVTINTELISPFPGAINDKSLRLFAFYDVGNAFAENEPYRWETLRTSAGVGLTWISPMGPLRLAYGRPIRVFSGDKINRLQFQIGTVF